MEDEEKNFGNNLENEPLTRAEIEHLAKKKGIKLTEDDILKMMNGDKDALAKLKLTDQDKKDIAENWNLPKLTRKEIEDLAK